MSIRKARRIPSEMSLSEARTRLSEVAHAMENGGRVTLTYYGRPVADLVPHDPAAARVRLRPNRVTPKPGPSADDVVRELRRDR